MLNKKVFLRLTRIALHTGDIFQNAKQLRRQLKKRIFYISLRSNIEDFFVLSFLKICECQP